MQRREVHVPIENSPQMCNQIMKGILGRFTKHKELVIIGEETSNISHKEHVEENQDNEQNHDKFSSRIEEAITNRRAIAAVDASIKESNMAACSIITSLDNNSRKEGQIWSTKWRTGSKHSAEGLGICNLVKVINAHAKHMNTGEIVICSDSKKIINGCYMTDIRESQCAQEASAAIAGIKKELEKSHISITLEYSNDRPKPNKTLQQEPGPILVKACDEKSKHLRETLTEDERQDIPHIAPTAPIHEGEIKDKAVAVLIREVDAIKYEEEYAKSKLFEKWNWVDINARNMFHKGIGAGTLKCVTGYNHCGIRNKMINNGLASDKCPRCGQEET